MEVNKNMKLAFLSLTLLTGVCVVAADLSGFWQRDFTGNSFIIDNPVEPGSLTAFVSTSWDEYQAQNERIQLVSGLTMISITQNTYSEPLQLEVIYTSTAPDMVLIATGQYLSLSWASSTKTINPVGSPFIIPTDGTPIQLNTANMMWADCAQIGVVGYALRIVFSLDTSLVTTPGTYTYDISIGIGIEELV